LKRADKDDSIDDPRRRFLVRALSLGLFAGGTGWNLPALAALFGKLPGKLPEGRSFFEIRGDVEVNGKPADSNTLIRPTDRVRTGDSGYAVYAVGSNAFILRERSAVEMSVGSGVKQILRLVTGKMLGVFGRRKDTLQLHTPIATIGIRGTGVYAEAGADQTYLCTCYGTTELRSIADATSTEQVQATHHNARYILKDGKQGRRIVRAPFVNHTDLELMTLEALVGREVPFALPDANYQAPRREY
jgi:hypothetical protein